MLTPSGVGLQSLAVRLPSQKLTNAFFEENHAEALARAKQGILEKVFSVPEDAKASPFDVEMTPYVSDPFRGSKVRYNRAPDETALSMELGAARAALAAANLTVADLDLVLVSSFPPDQMGPGNATYLAREIEARCPVLNFETACSGSVVGFHTACSLVRSGDYRRVLVVISNSNSLFSKPSDSLRWFSGDGAAAFVVGAVEQGFGIIAHRTIPTIQNIDMFKLAVVVDDSKHWHIESIPNKLGNQIARTTPEPLLRGCTDALLDRAGLTPRDVDFFVFNSPTAWYPAFCARVLGVDSSKWISTYPLHANMGAAMMPATLHKAASEGRIKRGDRVMLYSIGSTATASAVLLRWNDTRLGPDPF